MHELALCQGLIGEVERVAALNRATRVEKIELLLGPLSGAEAPLLERAFSVARTGTIAAQAELVIQRMPVTIRCRSCGAEQETGPNELVCKSCGNWQVEVTGGAELLLKSLELSGVPEDA